MNAQLRRPLMLRAVILQAASARSIPRAFSGLWRVRKLSLDKEIQVMRGEKAIRLSEGHYTQLFRYTQETMHLLGELVMQDTFDELKTHLDFMMRAHGDVLITGLGLGCVARGAMANPAVKSVTVIERDSDVLKLVAQYLPAKIRIIQAEAVQWCKETEQVFDCAWHDLWSDPDKGEPHLQLNHCHMFCDLAIRQKVRDFQGCWKMPRPQRRFFNKMNSGRML